MGEFKRVNSTQQGNLNMYSVANLFIGDKCCVGNPLRAAFLEN